MIQRLLSEILIIQLWGILLTSLCVCFSSFLMTIFLLLLLKKFFLLFSAKVLLFCHFKLFVNSCFFLLTFHSWSPYNIYYNTYTRACQGLFGKSSDIFQNFFGETHKKIPPGAPTPNGKELRYNHNLFTSLIVPQLLVNVKE